MSIKTKLLPAACYLAWRKRSTKFELNEKRKCGSSRTRSMAKHLVFLIFLGAASGQVAADFVPMQPFAIGDDGCRSGPATQGYVCARTTRLSPLALIARQHAVLDRHTWEPTTQLPPALGMYHVLTPAPIDFGYGHACTSASPLCGIPPKPEPPNVVPIPAAAWLFASALLGMVGIGVRGRGQETS